MLEKTLESPLNCKEIKPVNLKGNQSWIFIGRTGAKAEAPTLWLQYFTWCEVLTRWKSPWCCERLKAGEEGDDRGLDSWMESPTWWTWIWVSSGSCWWTGKPGMLQSMGLQRFRHDWVTELNCYIPAILSSFLALFSFFLNHWKVKLSVLWQMYSKIIQYVCL